MQVSRSSWHYRYYSWLRWKWGGCIIPARTNLCLYVQGLFWLTAVTLAVFPFLVIGYPLAKFIASRNPNSAEVRDFEEGHALIPSLLTGLLCLAFVLVGCVLLVFGSWLIECYPAITAFLYAYFGTIVLCVAGAIAAPYVIYRYKGKLCPLVQWKD